MTRKNKPASAYAHYQKLVQDFDALEREMQTLELTQGELEAQLERSQARIRASKAEEQQVEQTQWERERDRQLETLVLQRSTLDTLCAQTEALAAEEFRLQAEMEVLREKQREASKTEAQQIRRFVHERTTLLEDELAKGKTDLDYIAHVVSTARRQELKQREVHKSESSSVKMLVQDVQERRQREFEASEDNFRERMRSFQLEKDAIARKAKELGVIKQRALQILSQNQQQAIKGFFDTVPSTQELEEKEPSIPSLDFGEILQSLNQSGTQVEHIQIVDSERNSGRRELENALKDARLAVERGPERVDAIQKRLLDRKNEAQKLGIVLELSGTNFTGYDGAWGIESYSPRQYDLVYFIRRLIFLWMDNAVEEVGAQPPKELLELEVKRWEDTHSSVERECNRERTQGHAVQLLTSLIGEVTAEIAEDIRSEFESSAKRVRVACSSAFRNMLFTTTNEKLGSPAKKQPAKSQTLSQPPLRWSLFESSYDHIRLLRSRKNASKSTILLHQRSQSVMRGPTTTIVPQSAKKSPAKKSFGFFNTSKTAEEALRDKQVVNLSNSEVTRPDNTEVIGFLAPGMPTSSSSMVQRATTFWQHEPSLRLRTITTPSSIGCCSCLHLSPNGDLLICGTTDGELVLWDLLPDLPRMLRMWSSPKAQRSRITRVALSADAQIVIAFFRRKAVNLYAVNPTSTKINPQTKFKPSAHSEDCFPTDSAKYKPRNLDLLVELTATNALIEPSFTPELKERAPTAVAKTSSSGWAPAELSCGHFFPSFSLVGLSASDTNVLCGTTTGDLLKYNLQPQRESGAIQQHGIQAAFDAPGPDDSSLDKNTVRREFFRGHRQIVLFASCIDRKVEDSRDISKPIEILSVDQGGVICLWEYSAARFTGIGWFEPTLKMRLELMCSSLDLVVSQIPSALKRLPSRRSPPPPDASAFTMLTGEILQIALTPDDARLVCMMFYADPTKKEVAGTLRFLQLLTGAMRLDPVQLNVSFTGGRGPPRFALTASFLLLLANNVVRVFTLRTGKEVREPIALVVQGQQQVTFNSITSVASSSPGLRTSLVTAADPVARKKYPTTTLTFVVASDQHSRILVHSFTASTPQGKSSSDNITNTNNGR